MLSKIYQKIGTKVTISPYYEYYVYRVYQLPKGVIGTIIDIYPEDGHSLYVSWEGEDGEQSNTYRPKDLELYSEVETENNDYEILY